jgi:hypothetical protein
MQVPGIQGVVGPSVLLGTQRWIVECVAVPKAIREDLVPNNALGPGGRLVKDRILGLNQVQEASKEGNKQNFFHGKNIH